MTVTIESSKLSRSVNIESVSPAAALGCIGLFLLPFAAVGVGTAVTGLRHLAQGNWREGLMLTLFGLVFGGFAGVGGTAIVVGRRKLKDQEVLRARHPDQPWLWRPDWASGRISDSSHGTMWVSWAFAVLWNLISVPVGYIGLQAALVQGNPEGFVALFFPLVGLGLLTWATRATLRYRKYGMSRLELGTIPGTIGRSLSGSVRVGTSLQPEDSFQVRLTCIHRVTTRSGKNSSVRESILWQEETRAEGQSSRDSSGMGTRIPVAFAIPSDAQPSEVRNPRDQIVWRLELSANVPGVDYASVFEVPVFRTPESNLRPTQPEARLTESQAAAVADYKQSPESKIVVTSNRRGTEIVFPAARNPGVAVGTTVFMLFWGAMVVALVRYDAPVLFPIVFGLFELLLIVGALQFWFGVSRVTANAGTLVVAQGYFYPVRERTIPVAEIGDVSVKVGMQAGSRPYYDLIVGLKNGRRLTAGRSMRDKPEAEWLALTIKNALGLDPRG